MNTPKDVLGRDLNIGARVGCAFSYSQASVGHIRLGTIEEMYVDNKQYSYTFGEVVLRVRWEADNALSPKMKYGSESRWILL